MTDYDPNLFVSLAQSYLGGITLPRPDQAGYRVFVNADGTNLQYVDGAAESLPAFGLGEALWHLRVNATGTAVEWVALGSDLVLNQSVVDGGAGSVSDALDALDTALGDYLPLAGGTMSGDIVMGGNDLLGVDIASVDKYVFDRGFATIAGGQITPTHSYMLVSNEGAAPNDDLVTITAGTTGQRLLIQQSSAAQDIRLLATGNITLPGGMSYLQMTSSDQFVELEYHPTYGGTGRWMVISISPGVQHDGPIYVGNVNAAGGTFTAVVSGVTPTLPAHFATKGYVDTVTSLEWQDAVLSVEVNPPGSPTTGDRYAIGEAATGAWAGHDGELTEWTGTDWVFVATNANTVYWRTDVSRYHLGTSSRIENRLDHGNLGGLSDDDHSAYLPRTGTRSMTGDLNAGDNSLINVEGLVLNEEPAEPALPVSGGKVFALAEGLSAVGDVHGADLTAADLDSVATFSKRIYRRWTYRCTSVPGTDVTIFTEAETDLWGCYANSPSSLWSIAGRLKIAAVTQDGSGGANSKLTEFPLVMAGDTTYDASPQSDLGTPMAHGASSITTPDVTLTVSSNNFILTLDRTTLDANTSYQIVLDAEFFADDQGT